MSDAGWEADAGAEGLLEDLTADRAARLLDAHPDYRVLRRMPPVPFGLTSDATHLGLVVDTETTGLDASVDEAIELALVPFHFDAAGHITWIGEGVGMLQEPREPLSEEVAQLTGLTMEQLAGQQFDRIEIAAWAARADLLVAHNAAFDRPFVERIEPLAVRAAWACSIEDVDWPARGVRYPNLANVLAETRREFYDAHRALVDCHAVLRVLTVPDIFPEMLNSVRLGRYRVWANGAPFAVKGRLKARRYRWEGDSRKTWYRDCRTAEAALEEVAWLETLYQEAEWAAGIERLTARTRFRNP